jgi:hypothetical protein
MSIGLSLLSQRDAEDATNAREWPARAIVSGDRYAHVAPFMVKPSPLDDPASAAFAWARFKRIMRLMTAVTAAVVVAALGYLWLTVGAVPIHFYIAAALGIGFSMLLTSALMGLVFMSSGTGHDDSLGEGPDDPPRG